MIKSGLSLAAFLAATLPASAQILAFSGNNSLSLEGGISAPVNGSTGSILVENNIGAGAPWAVIELVPASVLNFGRSGSFGAEIDLGLENGKSLYLRISGNSASGSTDLAPLFSVTGAIPGIHDDGRLIPSTAGPVARVDTRMRDGSFGLKTAPGNGISYFAGVFYGEMAQDLFVTLDIDTEIPGNVIISGRSTNALIGAEIGASISRNISDKLKLTVFGQLAALSNGFDYSFDYTNTTLGGDELTYTQAGRSFATRSEISAQLAYAQSESVSFTGKIGYVNYSNVSTGLENTINPNNTVASITPVFGSIGVPYIRAGVAISF